MVEVTINFFATVAAGVISYYICKWLDWRDKGG